MWGTVTVPDPKCLIRDEKEREIEVSYGIRIVLYKICLSTGDVSNNTQNKKLLS